MKILIFTICFVLSIAMNCFSQPLLLDNFNYTSGSSISSNGWTAFSSTVNPVNVTSPGLTLSGYPFSGIGNAATLTTTGEDDYKNLSSVITSGSVYAFFMVKITSAVRPGDYFTAFLPSNSITNFEGRVHVRLQNGSVEFGLTKASPSDTNSMVWVSGYSLNTTYMVALQYKFNPGIANDEVSLYIGTDGFPLLPIYTIPPLTFSSTSADAVNIGRLALRQGTTGRAPGLIVDGILVTDSWINGVSFFQRNYNLGNGMEFNSDWGEMELSFYGFTGMKYLNLSINSPGISTPWQIQNVPVVCYSSIGNFQKQSFAFEIGLRGIDISSLDYGYTLTDDPQIINPPILNFNAPVGESNYIVFSGLHEIGKINGSPPVTPAVPLKGKEEGQEVDTTTHALQDFPNQDCGINECVPAGISNSLKFLRKKHNLTFDSNYTSIDSAKKACKWDSTGAATGVWHTYKDHYMDSNHIPITTRRKLWDYIPNIFEEIDNDQDIEMTIKWSLIGNDTVHYHCVNLVGLKRMGNGKYQITIQDDRTQGAAGGPKTETMEWDSTTNKFTSGTYKAFDVSIFDFIIECPSPPKPTPVTPPNGSTGTPLIPNIGWNSTPSPGTTFRLSISADPNFILPIFDSAGISGNNITVPPGILVPNAHYFWKVRGIDSAGVGPWSDVWSFTTSVPMMTLNLTALIEGFYNPSSNSMTPDTVTVYLRNVFFPYSIVDFNKSMLNSSGSGTFLFANAVNGVNYYLVVKHRNSIETWSMNGMSFTAGAMSYNFTDTPFKAFGGNEKLVDVSPLRFAIYSGDVNQDETVDGTDLLIIDNDAANFMTGYLPSDVNGDGVSDGTDGVITENNAVNFITVIKP